MGPKAAIFYLLLRILLPEFDKYLAIYTSPTSEKQSHPHKN
jgi:hypothetical protein